MAIKDKMLMITPTTLTLVKERTYRELFKSIDEKMLTIKCLGIKEKKETMTHVKKTLYVKNISWPYYQGLHACSQGFHSPWASYLGHGSPVWACSQGMACMLVLSQSHGSSHGNATKAKATPMSTLLRENQKPIN